MGVLRSLTAFQMYRRGVQGLITGPRVVRFLTCSTVFFRSIAYCVKEAEQVLARLQNSEDVAAAAVRLSTDLIARHRTASHETDSSALLSAVQADLVALHGLIAATYFAPPPRGSIRGRQSQRQNA